MSYGFRFTNPTDPTDITTISDSIPHVLGTIDTISNSAGSLTVPEFEGQRPFFVTTEELTGTFQIGPSISITGNQITWTSSPIAITIMYGIF